MESFTIIVGRVCECSLSVCYDMIHWDSEGSLALILISLVTCSMFWSESDLTYCSYVDVTVKQLMILTASLSRCRALCPRPSRPEDPSSFQYVCRCKQRRRRWSGGHVSTDRQIHQEGAETEPLSLRTQWELHIDWLSSFLPNGCICPPGAGWD